jgi:hypothetical protein
MYIMSQNDLLDFGYEPPDVRKPGFALRPPVLLQTRIDSMFFGVLAPLK